MLTLIGTSGYQQRTDGPPGNPKVEMLSDLCKEEGGTLESTLPMTSNQFPHLYR